MKKFGSFLLWLPIVWYFGNLTYLYFFTSWGSWMDINPLAFIRAFILILEIPLTWILIVLGIIGYLMQRDSK